MKVVVRSQILTSGDLSKYIKLFKYDKRNILINHYGSTDSKWCNLTKDHF